MPPALDRLLTSPSALRLLRIIVDSPSLPTTILSAAHCCSRVSPRRNYSLNRKPPVTQKWRHWKEESRSNQGNIELESNGDLPKRKDLDTGPCADATELAGRLQEYEKLFGVSGVLQVWMDRSNYSIDLPTTYTPYADFLWGTFIKVPDLVPSVIHHAAELYHKTGDVYPHLYELCMGYWLPQDRHAQDAIQYHNQLRHRLGLRQFPLRYLACQGRQSFTIRTYETLLEVYKASSERDVYDEIVPVLYAKGYTAMARSWHTACVERGDLPSRRTATYPMVQRLMAEGATSRNHKNRLIGKMVNRLQSRQPEMNEDLVRRLRGRDIAPVRLEDSFCAKMFATRALPIDSVIKGLNMIGVNEIGPLAVQAMAVNVDPITELHGKFEDLKAAGIALQGCVFSLALEKFAMEAKFVLVKSMLQSDQHPEVYDDMKLQKELLDCYVSQKDWPQAHRTISILTLFHNDPAVEGWNMLLQAQLISLHLHDAMETLQSMRNEGVRVSGSSLKMIKSCLRPRHRARQPVQQGKPFDDLRFVTRSFITILEGGLAWIPPLTWREVLRRYGMVGRFRELQRLVYWLLGWYAPRHGTTFKNVPIPSFQRSAAERLAITYPEHKHYWNYQPAHKTDDSRHPIHMLFPHGFQQGLIVWGFRAGILPHARLEQNMLSYVGAKKRVRKRLLREGAIKHLHWTTGLQTLAQLRDYGAFVDLVTVYSALEMMYTVLFGHGWSAVRANRIMRQVHNVSHDEFVREINRVWGTPLYAENSRSLHRIHTAQELNIDAWDRPLRPPQEAVRKSSGTGPWGRPLQSPQEAEQQSLR